MTSWSAVLAQSTSFEYSSYTSNPFAVVVGLVVLLFWIYCAYKTASNGRWLLFVLGFCFPIIWIVGAALGRKSDY